jgi:small redox-active disulfide protein 2
MKKIKVFGTTPPCARCKKTEQIAREVAAELGNLEVEKIDILSEAADKYGVMIPPTVVLKEKVIFAGKVPSKEELKNVILKNVK